MKLNPVLASFVLLALVLGATAAPIANPIADIESEHLEKRTDARPDYIYTQEASERRRAEAERADARPDYIYTQEASERRRAEAE
ncbi:hypothetical protein OC835_004081 [Tilletia horrida]|nr:hypothetical protein OC835_004081 [Tilletia horrida]